MSELTFEIKPCPKTNDHEVMAWTAQRYAMKTIKLSFLKDDLQKMLEFKWNGATDESATEGAGRLRKELEGH